MVGIAVRTRVFLQVLRVVAHTDVEGLDLEGIRRVRAMTFPPRGPIVWVTGPMPRTVRVRDSTFRARDGHHVPVRIYRPAGATAGTPAVVFFHGGGWVVGSPRLYDSLCAAIAEQVPAVVFSVGYRLAPEHPAPQAAYDAIDAIRWVADSAKTLRLDPERIAVAGDSAGGNLAAVASHVLRDEGGPKLAHQALIYPGTDATMSFPSVHEFADGPMLTKAGMTAFLGHYLDASGLDRTDPIVSPLWATDHTGLPPALVQTGDHDPLRDEGLAYAEAMRAAGVPVRVTNYLGAPHGFANFPGMTTMGFQARAEVITELRRHLH